MRLDIKGLTVELGGERVLDNVSFSLEGPSLVALLGPNGAGKTTLMRAILGLVKPRSGRIVIDGVDVTGRPRLAGKRSGYVPQRPAGSGLAPITVWELVCTGLSLRRKRWPRLRCPDNDIVGEALRTVGLPAESWSKRLDQLSGGMLMRSFIARSLAHGPELLLLDEPFAPVDPPGRRSLAKVIAGLARERLVIVSLHDLMLLAGLVDRVILLNRRLIAVGPPEAVMKPNLLIEAYGDSFLPVERHLHILDWH